MNVLDVLPWILAIIGLCVSIVLYRGRRTTEVKLAELLGTIRETRGRSAAQDAMICDLDTLIDELFQSSMANRNFLTGVCGPDGKYVGVTVVSLSPRGTLLPAPPELRRVQTAIGLSGMPHPVLTLSATDGETTGRLKVLGVEYAVIPETQEEIAGTE